MFVSAAAVTYVTVYAGGAVHVLSIVSFIQIAERMYVCLYVRTFYCIFSSSVIGAVRMRACLESGDIIYGVHVSGFQLFSF